MEKVLKITNLAGLHARPVVMLVKKAREFKSTITYIAKGKVADGKNVLPLTSLGLQFGDDFTIVAKGEDEDRAIFELSKIVEDKFGEHR